MKQSGLMQGLGLDLTLRQIKNVIGRLMFDSAGRLRTVVDLNASQTLGTVTTVTTVSTVSTVTTMATGNIGVGDMGKNNTSILMSAQAVANGPRRNFK